MDTARWFVIRVTHGRTMRVCQQIEALQWPDVEVYCPCAVKASFVLEGKEVRQKVDSEQPLLPGFLFFHSSLADYERLLEEPIKGLTPYYDHFRTIDVDKTTNKRLGYCRNPYLTVPERQMDNFRRYCEVHDAHKLVDQHLVPTYLNGRRVRITSGPFAGVEGTVLRWHSMRRVFLTLANLGTFGTGFIRSCDIELLEDDEPANPQA